MFVCYCRAPESLGLVASFVFCPCVWCLGIRDDESKSSSYAGCKGLLAELPLKEKERTGSAAYNKGDGHRFSNPGLSLTEKFSP